MTSKNHLGGYFLAKKEAKGNTFFLFCFTVTLLQLQPIPAFSWQLPKLTFV